MAHEVRRDREARDRRPNGASKNAGIKELYKALEDDVSEIETEVHEGDSKKPSEQRLNEHLRDAELYEKTEKKVSELYGKLLQLSGDEGRAVEPVVPLPGTARGTGTLQAPRADTFVAGIRAGPPPGT